MLSELEHVLCQARQLGDRELENGAHLWGRAPHVAPNAWLHVTYRGLSSLEIDKLEVEIGIRFPVQFRQFLTYSNGLSIYSGSLAIYGLRKSYDRVGDAAWQPFEIQAPNVMERPPGLASSSLVVGGYFDDGSKLVIDGDRGLVHRLPQRQSSPVLNTWSGFDAMLSAEILRLARLFDDTGRMRDASMSTIP